MKLRKLLMTFAASLAGLMACNPPTSITVDSVTSLPVPDDEVIVLATGWRRGEVDEILSKFERKYALTASALRWEEAAGGVVRIRFRQPIPADQLLFLINYIHYPEGFDLTGKAPVAVAFARLGAAFGVTSPSMANQLAVFYSPTNDTQYDEVYASLADGKVYKLSFTDLVWTPVTVGRQSDAVIALLDSRAARDAMVALKH